MRAHFKALSGSRVRAGLVVAAVVAGSTLATLGAASADTVVPPTLTGCPGGTTVIFSTGSNFGAYTYVWLDGFSTTHGDGATYHVTRSFDGSDYDLGDWSYWC